MNRLLPLVLAILLGTAAPVRSQDPPFRQEEALAKLAIRSIAGHDADLAVGTKDRGLFLRLGGTWKRLDRGTGLDLPSDYVTTLSWQFDRLWMGAWPGGLALTRPPYDRSESARRQGLEGETVHSIVETLGRDWFATTRGLFSSAGGMASPVAEVNPAFPEGIFAMSASGEGLVIGGVSGQVARLGADGWTAMNLPAAWGVSLVRDLAGDGKRIWAATDRGLASWNGKRWRLEGQEQAQLPRNGVNCLAWDGRSLWAGTWGQGLRRRDGERWSSFDLRAGLPSPFITALHVQGRRLWVGTETGLCSMNLDDPAERGRPPSERVNALVGSDDGGMVLASKDRGAWRLSTKGWERLAPDELSVLSVASRGDSVWLGTRSQGLWLHDGRGFRRIGTGEGLAGSRILALHLRGRFLAAGSEAGFSLYDGITWASYTPENAGLPHHEVRCVAPFGTTSWALGGARGVTIVGRREVLRRYTTAQGQLPSDEILCLVPGVGGEVLVGTDNGVAWISEDDRRGTRSLFLDARVRAGLSLGSGSWLLATSRGIALARGDRLDWVEGLPRTSSFRQLLRQGDELWIATDDELRRRPLRTVVGNIDLPPPDIDPSKPDRVDMPKGFVLLRKLVEGQRVFDLHRRGEEMWIATDGGLFRLQGKTIRSFDLRDGLCEGGQEFIASTGGDELFAAGAGGVSLFRGNRFRCHRTREDGIRSNGPNLLVAQDREALLSGEGGLDLWKAGRWTPLAASPLPEDLPVGGARDGEGRWLLCLREKGLFRLQEGSWKRLGPPSEASTGGAFSSMLRLPDGELLLGTENGMISFREGRWSRLRADLGEFADAEILDLCASADGRGAWALGRGHLSLLLLGRWHALPLPESASDSEVLSLAPTPDGGLLLGTSSGALILGPRQ